MPEQLESAGELGRLVAIDGHSEQVSVVVLDSGKATLLPLDFVPTRVVVSADGSKAVAAAPAAGRLAALDLRTLKVEAQASGLPPFRDLLPTPDGAQVLLAPQLGEAIAVHDLASGRQVGEVAPPRSGLGGFAVLTRAPSGRVAYARAAAAPVLAAIDLRSGKATAVDIGAGVGRAYTNAIGITLVLPDNVRRSVDLLPASLQGGISVAGEAGMTAVYSGWFDTVAFIPSTATRSVVVIDQQSRRRGDDIALGGVPGRGTVTPDGRKLYLPVMDGNRVAVINAEQRRLAGSVSLPGRPAIALMTRTFGICH